MLKIQYGSKFKKDYKVMIKRGAGSEKLQNIIQMIVQKKSLPPRNKDHALSGDYKGLRECHIEPDWLLIYQIKENALVLGLYEQEHTVTYFD